MTIKYSYILLIPALIIAFSAGFLSNSKEVSTDKPNEIAFEIETDRSLSQSESSSESFIKKSTTHELNTRIEVMQNTIKRHNEIHDKRLKMIEATLNKLAESEHPDTNTSDQDDSIDPQVQFDQERQNRNEQALAQTRIMDEALAQETRDEVWAPEMEATILSASSGEFYSGSTFTNPVCKSTFCSFEAYHSDEESKEKFENIRREIPNSYHIQHFEEPGGVIRSVMYLIKQGEEPKSVVFNTLNTNP